MIETIGMTLVGLAGVAVIGLLMTLAGGLLGYIWSVLVDRP
jgi:hypothetical protein